MAPGAVPAPEGAPDRTVHVTACDGREPGVYRASPEMVVAAATPGG